MTSDDPILACIHGRIAPNVALARLLLAGETPEGIRRRLGDVGERNAAWAALVRTAEDHADLNGLRRMIDALAPDHAGAASVFEIADLFDRAVAASPEASVAMYTLGDATLLAAATDEVVTWLQLRRLIGPGVDVLDLGCGIGRVAQALSPHVRSVLGIDVSPAMVREAERRCAGLANVSFAVTDGQDLLAWAEDRFSLVLAVDSFPYLVQAGLGERHVSESRRVLRAGGALVVLNLSYRNDPELDRRDARLWAARHQFDIRIEAEQPFRLWDSMAFVFNAGAE